MGRNSEMGNGPTPPWRSRPQPVATDLMVYVHAFRRHWLMAVGIGLLCAAIAGPAVWFADRGSSTRPVPTCAWPCKRSPLPSRPTRRALCDSRPGLRSTRATQQQLVPSRFVLLAALRKPEVAKLPVIQYEEKNGDPVEWLMGRISVGFPGRAEIMEVSLTREDPKEAAALVQAVVDAYMKEVVNAEQDLKRNRLSELDRAYVEKETEVRSKREDLKKLAEQLGTSDTETLTLKQKLALEELTIYRHGVGKVPIRRATHGQRVGGRRRRC